MKLVIDKYVGQLRYVPTMSMYESIFRIASTLSDSKSFKHWRAKRDPDTVLLFDNEKKESLEVDAKALTFTTENKKTSISLNSEVAKYAALFLEENDISQFNRIGLRKVAIYELDDKYEDFLEKFMESFFQKNADISSILADKFTDTLYLIESIKDGYSVRLQMAPLKPDQFKTHFLISEYTPENPLKKDTNFILDIDVYKLSDKNDFTYDDAMVHIDTINEMVSSIHKEVFSLVEKGAN